MAKKKTVKQIAKELTDKDPKNPFGANFRKNIAIGGKDGSQMPDFRKLGMGLDAKIEELKGVTEKSWAFRSRAGASGTAYAGGFYLHAGTADDFSPAATLGTANSPYAAHFYVVLGAETVDELTLTITGTRIDDQANRSASFVDTIVIPSGTAVNSYYETQSKWLGQISIEATSGTAKICDFGYAKYWDNSNSSFTVKGLEATWLGGASDSATDLMLRHHRGTSGNGYWTYTGTGATPPPAIASMKTDHVTEVITVPGEDGAWKRTNLDVGVDGSASCGTIIEIVTTANKAFELGNFLLTIQS